jgi:hypothetical protein
MIPTTLYEAPTEGQKYLAESIGKVYVPREWAGKIAFWQLNKIPEPPKPPCRSCGRSR